MVLGSEPSQVALYEFAGGNESHHVPCLWLWEHLLDSESDFMVGTGGEPPILYLLRVKDRRIGRTQHHSLYCEERLKIQDVP